MPLVSKNLKQLENMAINGLVGLAILTINSQISLVLLLAVVFLLYFKLGHTSYWLAQLIIGVQTFGYISSMYGIPHLGKIVGVTAIVALFINKDLYGIHKAHYAHALTGWTLLIIGLSLVCVPATELGIEKYFSILYSCAIFTVLMWILVSSAKVNLAELAYMISVLGLLYLSASDVSHLLNFTEFGNLRNIWLSFSSGERTALSYQSVGNNAAFAIILAVTFILATQKWRYYAAVLIPTILLSLVMLYISGARQSYAIIFACFLAIVVLRRQHYDVKTALILLSVVLILGGALVTAYHYNVDYIVSVVDEGDINRNTNYEAATAIIQSNLLWGVGLGNYYVPGWHRKDVTAHQWAHNLFLELFSELGVLLSVMLLFPWVLFSAMHFKNILYYTSKANVWIMPIMTFYILRAMISSDLSESIRIFVILAFIVNGIVGVHHTKDHYFKRKLKVT